MFKSSRTSLLLLALLQPMKAWKLERLNPQPLHDDDFHYCSRPSVLFFITIFFTNSLPQNVESWQWQQLGSRPNMFRAPGFYGSTHTANSHYDGSHSQQHQEAGGLRCSVSQAPGLSFFFPIFKNNLLIPFLEWLRLRMGTTEAEEEGKGSRHEARALGMFHFYNLFFLY